jgi:hypothetical protein
VANGGQSEGWRGPAPLVQTHLMGEAKQKRRAVVIGPVESGQPQVVDTLGGRMRVRWDEGAAATPHGQLVFFAEFLAATGVFERCEPPRVLRRLLRLRMEPRCGSLRSFPPR